jgi:uncharacterized protein YndB with AHSA1/START domain
MVGPDGFTTTDTFDFRAGGVWRFVMHGPDGSDYENRITFDEIVPPERIVYHHGGGGDVEPVQFNTTLTFEGLGGGKTRLTLRSVFPSAEERDRVIKEYGADKGLVQTLASWQLEQGLRHLARIRRAARTRVEGVHRSGTHAALVGPEGL